MVSIKRGLNCNRVDGLCVRLSTTPKLTTSLSRLCLKKSNKGLDEP